MTANSSDGPWYSAIHAKLAAVAADLPEQPAWFKQWLELGAKSTDKERLRAYQAIRDADVLPADAGFYLVTWHIDAMSSKRAEVELHQMDEQMGAIEREHGLEEDESWLPEEAPSEYEHLRRAYHAAWDSIFIRLLREFGEWQAADLFKQDHERFERRSEIGRAYFHGPMVGKDAPEWLEEFIEIITEQMMADSPMGPLKIEFFEEEELWEVVVYPTSVELVGGAQDGEIVAPGFWLDLDGLRSAFEKVTAMGWHALGLPPDEGPYVFVEGVFAGQEVSLRVLAYAPEDEEPGMKVHVTRGKR